VRWNLGEGSASIYVTSPREPEKLFVAGGATGKHSTGLWVKPGIEFVLKEQSTGKEVARVLIEGIPCK
jgi:hypothetical protein